MAEADHPVAHSDPTDTVTAVRRLMASDHPVIRAIEVTADELKPMWRARSAWKPPTAADVEMMWRTRSARSAWKKREKAIDVSEKATTADELELARQARLEWKKHEAAIEVFYKAFCNSELVTVVQLADGTRPQLAAWGWQEAAFWREMILGGKVRASAGEQFEPYAGHPIFIKAFQNWLDRSTQSKPPEPLQQPATNEVIASVPPVEEEQVAVAVSASAQPSAAEGIDPFNSGAGGRPTAMHLILREAKQRIEDGVFMPRRRGREDFAKELEIWWEQENHDHYESRGPKTTWKAIQNNQDFQNLWSAALAAAEIPKPNPETQ